MSCLGTLLVARQEGQITFIGYPFVAYSFKACNISDSNDHSLPSTDMTDSRLMPSTEPLETMNSRYFSTSSKRGNMFTCKDLVIKNEKVLDVELLKQIKDKTLKLSKNANDLYDFIMENGNQSVNKAMLVDLAYRLEDTAQYVNNASSVIYLYKQTIYSMKEIVKLAEKVK